MNEHCLFPIWCQHYHMLKFLIYVHKKWQGRTIAFPHSAHEFASTVQVGSEEEGPPLVVGPVEHIRKALEVPYSTDNMGNKDNNMDSTTMVLHSMDNMDSKDDNADPTTTAPMTARTRQIPSHAQIPRACHRRVYH